MHHDCNNSQKTTSAHVLWNGPLFGRLPKCGRSYLLSKGFQLLVAEPSSSLFHERLKFAWPNKSGPQFEMNDTAAPQIRPYPKRVTDLLDDKIRLADLLRTSSTSIAPKCIPLPDEADDDKRYFVKHRFGAQGKSVYCYTKQELKAWWERSRNRHDFVIQQEVIPALWQNRKFVLRTHILLFQTTASRSDGIPSFHAYLYKDIICQHHASEYVSGQKSAHVSQAGKKHPLPILLRDLDSSHPAANAFDKICAVSQELVSLARQDVFQVQEDMAPDATCFALLGTDLLVDEHGNVKICEVNSHPALGWGTMSQVEPQVFTKLIEDTLSILVFGEMLGDNGFLDLCS